MAVFPPTKIMENPYLRADKNLALTTGGFMIVFIPSTKVSYLQPMNTERDSNSVALPSENEPAMTTDVSTFENVPLLAGQDSLHLKK